MSLKKIIFIAIFSGFIFTEYLDTDCYKEAGKSTEQCKVLTTFINGTDEDFLIEANELYLCCYVWEQDYKGCYPIKEEHYFKDQSKIKYTKFDCFSTFLKEKRAIFTFLFFLIFLLC